VTTALGVYCVRRGDIRQHREWMTRSYPFAMVFVVARAVLAIPSVRAMGEPAFVSVVWSCVALACFVPSLIISWPTLSKRLARPAGRMGLGAKTAAGGLKHAPRA
jgi:hypothetical protein